MIADHGAKYAGGMKRLSADKNETPLTLPNFLIVGAAKCGTTSLYHYLSQHPDVFMSLLKEPRFFSGIVSNPGTGPGDSMNSYAGIGSFDEYSRLFKKSMGRKTVGEASTETLFHFESSIPAIHRSLGDPRIVIVLRDPVKRAYSAYNFQVQRGRESLSFKDAVAAEEQRTRNGYSHSWQYVKSGLYASGVSAFQENFSRVLVLLYDDLEKDALSLLRSLYLFLDVDPGFIPDVKHKHNVSGIPRWRLLGDLFSKPKRLHKAVRTVGEGILGKHRWVRLRERLHSTILHKPRPMDPDIELQLRQYYREDILKLQGYISRDLSAWLEGRKHP